MRQTENVADVNVVYLMEMPNGGASDAVLKKEIASVTTALERVLALRPVTWYWKSDVHNQELQHGFVAQEVEEVFPDLVATKKMNGGTSYKFLATKALVPYLVKAIEQQQQIDSLLKRIEASGL